MMVLTTEKMVWSRLNLVKLSQIADYKFEVNQQSNNTKATKMPRF